MIERKNPPPFGFKVKRFAAVGYHPGLEVRPGTYRYPNIFPGCYDWKKPQRIVSKVASWRNQEKTEEYSRRLGYRGDHVLKKAKWLKAINGPGWQEIPSPLLQRVISFPKAVRFPTDSFKSYAVPGPGTYGKNHVPYSRKEERSREKGFSFSNIPPFDQVSHAPRSLNTQQSYHLPPNLYKIKSSTDELVLKQISKRGPYDLFSGNRFPDPVLTGLSTPPQRTIPSEWNHPKNSFKGKFLRCGKDNQITSRIALVDLALAKKNPLDPGPNYYDPFPAHVVTPARMPFNSSVREVRPVLKCGLSPPPGRYNPEFKRKILGDGMKSAFLSKVKRSLPQAEKHSWFE